MEEGQRGAGTLARSPQSAYRPSCLLALTLLTTQACRPWSPQLQEGKGVRTEPSSLGARSGQLRGWGSPLGPHGVPGELAPTPCVGLGPRPAWKRQESGAPGCWPLAASRASCSERHLSGIPMEKTLLLQVGPVALRFPVWWFADVWDPGWILVIPTPCLGWGAPTFC